MGDLAGDHVDFVGLGHGDDHVRVAGRRAFQHSGMGRETDHGLNIECVSNLTDLFLRLVDNGDVVVFGGQLTRNMEPDLARAANDNFHL